MPVAPPAGSTTSRFSPILPPARIPAMDWSTQKVLVTGGASFIGSHLVDALVERGAQVRVVDDLSSGRTENIAHWLELKKVEFVEADLLNPGVAEFAVAGMDHVFH